MKLNCFDGYAPEIKTNKKLSNKIFMLPEIKNNLFTN